MEDERWTTSLRWRWLATASPHARQPAVSRCLRRKVQRSRDLGPGPRIRSSGFSRAQAVLFPCTGAGKSLDSLCMAGETGAMNEPFASTILATVETDGRTAQRLADGLTEALDPGETAIAAFEAADRSWTVEIYFEHAPDEAAVRRLVADLAGEARRASAGVLPRRRPRLGRGEPRRPAAGPGRPVLRARRPSPRTGAGEPHRHRDRGGARLRDRPSRHHPRLPAGARRHRQEVSRASPAPPLPARGERVGVRGRFRPSLAACEALQNLTRWRVLDVGTGTGVLAIAAARALRGSRASPATSIP